MTDYGRDLIFGTFLTPAAASADEVVALAQLSEQVGLDLVTFQDHPYQPAFLDTWTLLSFAAARTSTIRLAPNVANLPLRPPAVLARSVASLDLLSGGRVELGLGTGAFWDAIEAMGGRRLTPGQAVQALEEAIAVIRQVWDAGARGGVRVEGEHHRVVGAKRGPAPAHDVGIWVGAYKPRMLRLTGRLADGWLPSLSYLPGGAADLAGLNALVDEGAAAAGRDLHAVRRLLNVTGRLADRSSGPLDGPPDQWVEELAGMTLEHGVSGFVLGTDDPAVIRLFAAEVVPAVRELVAAERAGTGDGVHVPTPVGAEVAAPGAPTPTPDPAVRLTDERLLDEETRPVAPPPAEAPAPTERGRAVGQHLVDVHDHLRGELRQVRDLVEQVRNGTLPPGAARSAINETTMRQNSWTLGAYCAAYCRVVTQHHGIEDSSIFPHLRSSDPGLAPVIDRLEQEHHVVHEVLENLDRALVDHVSASDGLDRLQHAVDLLSDVLLSHLAYEEQQIVDPLARYGFYAGQL